MGLTVTARQRGRQQEDELNPWWLVAIVPASIVAGMIGFVLLCWFTRNVFPTLFVPDDF